MKYKIITIAILGLAMFLIFNIKPANQMQAYLQIGQNKIEIEIADDADKRTRGLSGRANLAQNHGLLFIFDTFGNYGFWMKEMNFPIDVIWIDENWRVADISKNASPESYPQVFLPSRPIKYVLEVNAGWSEKNNLKIGTIVQPFF